MRKVQKRRTIKVSSPGVDRARIVEEAEFFGLDSMLAQMRLHDEEEDKARLEEERVKAAKAKRVIIYSVRQLRVVECCSILPGDSFCSKVSKGISL